nr:nucleolar complex protein 2 [Quercus suber]
MGQTKATKKFEKRHLKDELERRKGLKSVKQKQQLKAKKKARRVEENGGEKVADQETTRSSNKAAANDAFKDMSVDDFFQGGFEIPELPKSKKSGSKRKRQEALESAEDDDSVSFEQEPVPIDDADTGSDLDEDDYSGHKDQLAALAENDPEFHKYLQENEPELLDASLAEIGDLSDSEAKEDGPRKKKQKKAANDEDDSIEQSGKNELDMATVKKWRAALTEQHSLRAAKEVILAFRSAAHVSDEEDKDFKYSISSPEVYHQLITTALKHIPAVFEHHLPVQQSKSSGKIHVSTESKKFKTLSPLLRSQVTSVVHLLDHLSDPSTLRLTLTSTIPLLPYLLSFKKVVRDLCRVVAGVWSSNSNTEATRIAAFLLMRRLVLIGDAGIRENVLKTIYQSLVQSARTTTTHTLAGVNLMKNSAAELWGLSIDGGVAYTTAFTSIRQLAVHLRTTITHNSNDSYKAVYNWQYTHSLDFWSRVLSAHATTPASPLHPLIYPLTQVTLGALRLIPTATYFPLRFQLTRSLLRMSLATNTYIPLAAPLYEVLNSAEMRKPPKAASLKPLDFETSIRASKAYLRTRVYQDGVGEQVVELLSEFLVLWARNVAFPELATPVIIMLKRWIKDTNRRGSAKDKKSSGNKNGKLNSSILLLVQKLEANTRFIEEKRSKIDIAPNNRKGVEQFLSELEWDKTVLGAFVIGQRKQREERRRVIEEGRKDEEQRRKREKSRGGEGYDGEDSSAGAFEEEAEEESDVEEANGFVDSESE